MGALHLGIGFELGQHFRGDGQVVADAPVEGDPGTLFLGLDAGATAPPAACARDVAPPDLEALTGAPPDYSGFIEVLGADGSSTTCPVLTYSGMSTS